MGNYFEMAKAVAGSIAARRAAAIGTQGKGVSDGGPTEQWLAQASASPKPNSTPAKVAEMATDPAPEAAAPSLKGQAVELWRDGRRFFLVADDADALEAMRRFGAHRGEVWTSGELELVASIPDQATRDEIEAFKRQMDGCLAPGMAGKCISSGERQAQMLNRLFKEQGVTGQPGNITAKTVKNGEAVKGNLK